MLGKRNEQKNLEPVRSWLLVSSSLVHFTNICVSSDFNNEGQSSTGPDVSPIRRWKAGRIHLCEMEIKTLNQFFRWEDEAKDQPTDRWEANGFWFGPVHFRSTQGRITNNNVMRLSFSFRYSLNTFQIRWHFFFCKFVYNPLIFRRGETFYWRRVLTVEVTEILFRYTCDAIL